MQLWLLVLLPSALAQTLGQTEDGENQICGNRFICSVNQICERGFCINKSRIYGPSGNPSLGVVNPGGVVYDATGQAYGNPEYNGVHRALEDWRQGRYQDPQVYPSPMYYGTSGSPVYSGAVYPAYNPPQAQTQLYRGPYTSDSGVIYTEDAAVLGGTGYLTEKISDSTGRHYFTTDNAADPNAGRISVLNNVVRCPLPCPPPSFCRLFKGKAMCTSVELYDLGVGLGGPQRPASYVGQPVYSNQPMYSGSQQAYSSGQPVFSSGQPVYSNQPVYSSIPALPITPNVNSEAEAAALSSSDPCSVFGGCSVINGGRCVINDGIPECATSGSPGRGGRRQRRQQGKGVRVCCGLL